MLLSVLLQATAAAVGVSKLGAAIGARRCGSVGGSSMSAGILPVILNRYVITIT